MWDKAESSEMVQEIYENDENKICSLEDYTKDLRAKPLIRDYPESSPMTMEELQTFAE